MRTPFLAMALLLSSSFAFAHESDSAAVESEDRDSWKFRTGFGFGITRHFFDVAQTGWQIPTSELRRELTSIDADGKLGFVLNVSAEARLLRNVVAGVQPSIGFTNYQLNFRQTEGFLTGYIVKQAMLDFPLYVQYRWTKSKLKPSLSVGTAFKVNTQGSEQHGVPTFWSADVRIGMEKAFTDFFFVPELRYSHGLSESITRYEAPNVIVAGNTTQHQLSLILNIRG